MPLVVALLAEGVDRNFCGRKHPVWRHEVALLAEGVDRNPERKLDIKEAKVALLAEGVVEMMLGRWITYPMPVALLAEGVDRNSSMPSPAKL